MGINVGPIVPDASMISYWDAGNYDSYPGSGTTWYDLVGGHHLTQYSGGGAGVPAWDERGFFTFVPSGGFWANASSLGITLTTELTMIAWYKFNGPQTASDFPRIFEAASADGATDSHGLVLYYTERGDPRCWWENSVGTRVQEMDASVNNGNQAWHMLASTIGTGDGIMYFDGENINSSAGTPTLDNINYVGIGQRPGPTYNTNTDFDGDIALVVMYNRALTSAEIKKVYVSMKPKFDAIT